VGTKIEGASEKSEGLGLTKSGEPKVENRQLKVQKLQANGISQRRLLRLCHLLNTRHQQRQNEEEKQQESNSSNNLPELLKKQRGIDNG
jgi:hypothetical protein